MKNLWAKITLIVTAACIALLFIKTPLNFGRESFSEFQYITNFETTKYNEIYWFWTWDSLFGRFHSNDFIGLKYSPHFFGKVSTSQQRFIYYQPQNIYFAEMPQLGSPIRVFPQLATSVRENAHPWVDSNSGRLMTRIILRGEDGIDVYQYVLGLPPHEDSLLMHLNPPEEQAIFVDGQVELKGTLSGTLTIGSAGDMGLLDNIIYTGANQYNGWFDPDSMEHMLGFVSERNIIIKNTPENGRENGWSFGANLRNSNRHSININAALLALGGSFTFENQNDDFEHYQGPTPDERGVIYLTGSIAQYRRGYTRRSNHGTGNRDGTGYGMSREFDIRFIERRPPHFPEVENFLIPGQGNYLDLEARNSPYTIDIDAQYDSLMVEAGTEIIMMDSVSFRSKPFYIQGTEESPIRFIHRDAHGGSLINEISGGDDRSNVVIRHTIFDPGIQLRLEGDTTIIESSSIVNDLTVGWIASLIEFRGSLFSGRVTISGRIDRLIIDSCTFEEGVDIRFANNHPVVSISNSTFKAGLLWDRSWGSLAIDHCIIEDGLYISGDHCIADLVNNNFINSDSYGLHVLRAETLRVVNCIVAYNRVGVQADTGLIIASIQRYNDFWSNDISDCIGGLEPGEGSISSDPLFVDPDNGDYHLQPGSPCINTGDPDSPLDPDGSRADIGAIPFDARGVYEDPDGLAPQDWTLTAYPNPFNDRVTVALAAPTPGDAMVKIVSVDGRLVDNLKVELKTGVNRLSIGGERFTASGVYIIQIETGNIHKTVKAVYLP